MKWKEGDTYICKKCNTQVRVKKIQFQGDERLSHRNPDGSPHFYYDEDKKEYKHTPTKMTEDDVWKMEMEERVSRLERENGIVRVE